MKFGIGILAALEMALAGCVHSPGPTETQVSVEISGFVARPGVYQVHPDSNFETILKTAGGFERPERDNDYTTSPSSITLDRKGRIIRIPCRIHKQPNARAIHLEKGDKLSVDTAVF